MAFSIIIDKTQHWTYRHSAYWQITVILNNMLSVTYAECHLCWVSLMLSVTYAECHLFWVSLMPSVTYAECHLCWVSLMLSVTCAECHLCWLSHLSPFVLSVVILNAVMLSALAPCFDVWAKQSTTNIGLGVNIHENFLKYILIQVLNILEKFCVCTQNICTIMLQYILTLGCLK